MLVRARFALLVVLVLLAAHVEAQRFQGAVADLLPAEITTPFSGAMTPRDLDLRLAEGGEWSFRGDVVFGAPDPSRNEQVFLAVDVLRFEPGARVVTNGNTLTIFVNELHAGDGQIVAFRPEDAKARYGDSGSRAGARGQDGRPGDSGGAVSIHVVKGLHGLLTVDLSGQHGGDGGAGGQGERGARGSNGANGKSTLFDCRSGGENGGNGHRGSPGGDGGDGGNGGSAGTFYLFNIGEEPLPASSFRFVGSAGEGGQGGAAGPGGSGGDGGRRGGGDGHCSGGDSDGNEGPPGPPGQIGHAGVDGAPSEAIVQAIALEAAIDRARRSPGT